MINDNDKYPEDGTYLFRCEASYVYPSRSEIYCYSYRVIKESPKGKWIVDEWVSNNEEDIKRYQRFVLNDAMKRFAYETREGARLAFLHRKRRQIELLISQLERTENAYVSGGGELPIPRRNYRYFDDY